MDPIALYEYFTQHPIVCTDTRQIQPDCLFFALKGDLFNGNTFALQALENGAAYAIIDEEQYRLDERFIVVQDALIALQDIARIHRKHLNIPVLGITGTNGKTTTKELVHAVLAERFRTFATKGNLNNHIGVPLTILAIPADTEIAVIEMGANHPGEIAMLSSIAQPTHGLITNVGKAHLEGFGGFAGVIKTKGELYDYLAAHQATLFIQQDNPLLVEMARDRQIQHTITYGFSSHLDITGQLLQANPLLEIEWTGNDHTDHWTVQTHLTGSYNTENVLAAISIGVHFGMSPAAINAGLSAYRPNNNRSQLTKTANNTVICDYYNANASSMAAALDNLAALDHAHKAIVLGDMFELGDESDTEHRRIVDQAYALNADRLVFVGKHFHHQQRDGAEFYESVEQARTGLTANPILNSVILLKASRGMAFEKLLDLL